MAYVISKTLTVTRVKYQTVVVEDGAPKFVEHPDAVFRGILTQERAQRMLQSRLGKDVILVITNVDAGQKRFEMDMEQFILHAQVADGEEVPDEDEAGEPAEPAEEETAEEPSESVDVETSESEEEEPSENPSSEEPASGESEKEPEEQLTEEDKRRFAPPSWWEES